jgi:hypothetical protein
MHCPSRWPPAREFLNFHSKENPAHWCGAGCENEQIYFVEQLLEIIFTRRTLNVDPPEEDPPVEEPLEAEEVEPVLPVDEALESLLLPMTCT